MSNVDVIRYARRLKLPNFKYYMRDEMTDKKPGRLECGVINLDESVGNGTHHCCYWKSGDKKYYFDSFGLVPPPELVTYLKSPIIYNTYQLQQFSDTNCSEYCLYVLSRLNTGHDFSTLILDLIRKFKL